MRGDADPCSSGGGPPSASAGLTKFIVSSGRAPLPAEQAVEIPGDAPSRSGRFRTAVRIGGQPSTLSEDATR